MRHLLVISLCTTLLSLTSCEKGQDPIPDDNAAVALDISGAGYLFTTNTNTSNSNLYKTANSDTETIPVTFLNNDLEPVDTAFYNIQISAYYKLEEKLICLKGEFDMINDSSGMESIRISSLLVDLNTGGIYNFKGHYPEPASYYLGSEFVQKDASNNLYYSFGGSIHKLERNADNKLSISQYIPDGQDFNDFFIDRSGNCFYSSAFSSTIKIKLADGGIISTSDRLFGFFYDKSELFGINGNSLVQIDLNRSVNLIPVDSFAYDIEGFAYMYQNSLDGYTLMFLNGQHSSNTGYFGMVYTTESKEIHRLDLSKNFFDTRSSLHVESIYNNHLILSSADKTEIQKINLNNLVLGESGYLLEQNEKVTIPTGYQIYSLLVKDANSFTFSGLRFSDEKSVIAELDFKNDMKIVSESASGNIVLLDKIN